MSYPFALMLLAACSVATAQERLAPRQAFIDVPGAPESQVVYEYMSGPQEFFATGILRDVDLTARLHEIDVPVLFMTGEFDWARPETVAGFQRLVPGAQFTVSVAKS